MRASTFCLYIMVGACLGGPARADLSGQVYRIEYQNAGVEDCLRFADDGRFAADSSLSLPTGLWAQRGPVYTAHQNDANGNTFTWGGVQQSENSSEDRLVGAFVSSFGIRLGFAGHVDAECEVSFEDLQWADVLIGDSAPARFGEQIYEVRSIGGKSIDCFRLRADGEFTVDSLTALGLPPGAWHISGITVVAFQSGESGEDFSVNTWGGLTLAGQFLWLGVDSAGVGFIGRRNPACGVAP